MKDAHLHFQIGNVIRAPEGEGGDLWIVTEVTDRTIEAVSFDSPNCAGAWRLDDHDREVTCSCGDDEYHQGAPDEECRYCHGVGHYTVHVKGWSRAKILATTVKAFILNGVKRQFGF